MDGKERIDSIEALRAWIERDYPRRFNMKSFDRWVREGYGEDNWWHLRENIRNERRVTPAWVTTRIGSLSRPPVEKFFIHLVDLEPTKIAYTASDDDGRRDRQTITTVGRFLSAHYADVLTPAQMKKAADEHREMYAESTVFFSFDATEIEDVYKNGPSSCMTGKDWTSKESPVRVYDGPDVAIAYTKNSKGSIASRTMINLATNPMQYTRIYGDANVLTPRLTRLGFVLGTLAGARMRKEDAPGKRVICPYLDLVSGIRVDKDFIVPLASGGITCHRTDGHSDPKIDAPCAYCGLQIDRGAREVFGGEYVHERCAMENYVSVIVDINGNAGLIRASQSIVLGHTRFWNNENLLKAYGYVRNENGPWHIPVVKVAPPTSGGTFYYAAGNIIAG